MWLHSVSGLVQMITVATASPKVCDLSVGGTVPPAAVAIPGEGFPLGAITAIGGFT